MQAFYSLEGHEVLIFPGVQLSLGNLALPKTFIPGRNIHPFKEENLKLLRCQYPCAKKPFTGSPFLPGSPGGPGVTPTDTAD